MHREADLASGSGGRLFGSLKKQETRQGEIPVSGMGGLRESKRQKLESTSDAAGSWLKILRTST
jgi:hypothetical protein